MANLTGTPGPDTLEGVTGEDNLIFGIGGNDRLLGGGQFIGDPPSNDTLDGGEGNDTVLGLTGSDMLFGGPGDDELQGGPGAGGFEDDTLDGGPGADTMIGQAGNDVYFIDNPGDRVAEFSSDPSDEVRTTISVALASIETAAGGDPDQIELLTLLGSSDIDGTGNDLDNTITGNGGANMLDGGLGDDTLAGGPGDDTLEGGEGTDTAVFDFASTDMHVALGFGVFTIIEVGGGTDTVSGIELYRFSDITLTPAELPDFVNRAPTALDDTATAADLPITVDVLANDTDPDGNPLTITTAMAAQAGTVVLSDGDTTLTYTPGAGFVGVETVTYAISDGRGGVSEATLTVTATGTPNAPPVAIDDSAASDGGAVTIDVLANDTDPDGDPLTLISVTAALNGTVQTDGGRVVYTPAAGFSGVDTIDYRVGDGRGGLDTGTVTVAVAPSRVLPAGRDTFAAEVPGVTGAAGAVPARFDLGAFYGESFAGVAVSVDDPAFGTASWDGVAISYLRDPGYNGPDVIRYEYTVGDGVEVGRIVNLGWDTGADTVSPVDVNFGAVFSFSRADAGGSVSRLADGTGGEVLSIFGIDFDGDEEQARLDRDGVAPPDLSINAMSLPDLANGDLLDVLGAAVNDEGTLTFDLEIGGEMVFAIDLDEDLDSLDAVPDDTSSFLFRVRDAAGQSAVGVASVTVGTDLTPNAQPVARDDTGSVAGNETALFAVLANDTDADGDPLALDFLPADPLHGTATVEGGAIRYTPDPGFAGTDSLVYAIRDGAGGLAVAALEIDVIPPGGGTRAIAIDDTVVTDQFTPILRLDATANDLNVTAITQLSGLTTGNSARTEGGRIFNNGDGTLAYAPRRGFVGEDQFDYDIEGPDGTTDTGRVAITVAPLDDDLLVARLVGYLYEAGLGRIPAAAGLNHWTGKVFEGAQTETTLARAFLISEEFAGSAGGPVETLTDRELVEQLFLNVLGRPGAQTGIDIFVDNLQSPAFSREDLLITFAESPENLLGSPSIATIAELPDGSFDFA